MKKDKLALWLQHIADKGAEQRLKDKLLLVRLEKEKKRIEEGKRALLQ